ncbi:hypothetical protein B0O80DRAFT_460070 [Mortierella sp. GBAus27b]|nr:hypothetical protein BGX31_011365 [Mortierella sp. GBA43]KAI8349263.1 hypothetical protein B0O80DRAFT_460070 [Mortierella sp. GBAus27b]
MRLSVYGLIVLTLAATAISAPSQRPMRSPTTTTATTGILRVQASDIYKGENLQEIIQTLTSGLDQGLPEGWEQLVQAPQTIGTSGIETMNPQDLDQVLTSWQVDESFHAEVAGDIMSLVRLAVSDIIYVAQQFTYTHPSCLAPTPEPPASAEEGEEKRACLSTVLVVAKPKIVVGNRVWTTELIHFYMKSEAPAIQQNENYQCCNTCWLFFSCCDTCTRPRGMTQDELVKIQQALSSDQANWARAHPPPQVSSSLSSARVGQLQQKGPNGCTDMDSSNQSPAVWPISIINGLLQQFIGNKHENRDVYRKHDSTLLKALQDEMRHQKNIKKMLVAVNEQSVVPLLETMVGDCLKRAGIEESIAEWFKKASGKYPGQPISLECSVFTQRKQVISPPKPGCRSSTEISSKNIFSWVILSPRSTLIDTLIVQSSLDLSRVECDPLSSPRYPGHGIAASQQPEESTGAIVRWSMMHKDGSFNPVHYMQEWKDFNFFDNKAILDILRLSAATTYLRIGIPSSIDQEKSLTTTMGGFDAQMLDPALVKLGSAINLAVEAIILLITELRNSITEEVKLKVCLGFEKYNHMSKATRLSGIHPENLLDVVGVVVSEAHLPDNEDLKSIMMGIKYSDDEFTWTGESITYTAPDGKNHFLYLTKHVNPKTNKIDLVYGMVNSEFSVAPDMLIVRRRTSILGGIFGWEKTTFSTIPHELTLNDTMILEMYFETIVFRKMALVTGLPVPAFPDLAPLCQPSA